MGYRGKVVEQERARALRAEAWTLQEIADELGVAKSSVSLWVRDVAFVPRPRQPGPNRRPHPWIARKEAEIAELLDIPVTQFYKPYRAVPDPSIRKAKHLYGCPSVSYGCSRTHRNVMGLVQALLSSEALPG